MSHFASFDDLKNYAISDILSVNGKDKAARIIKNHMDNLIEVALIKGAQSRQAEIDELQKRIDAIKSKVQDLWTALDDRQSKEFIIDSCELIIGEILKGENHE